MTYLAGQALRYILPELSLQIVDESAQLGLIKLAGQLPEFPGSLYLERRLGKNSSAQVDLLVSVTKFQRAAVTKPLFLSESGMQGAKRLLERWSAPRSTLEEAMPVAWLEFDNVEEQERASANVCACIVPSYIDPDAPLTSLTHTGQLELLLELVEVIRGRACSSRECRMFEDCVRKLPPGSDWIHLSVMTARTPVELKLYGVFPQHALPGYLSALGWPDAQDEISRIIDRYCPSARTGNLLYVDLPLTRVFDAGLAALGICFSRQQLRTALEKDPTRSALLHALSEDGLCTPTQAEALAAWPGQKLSAKQARGARPAMEKWLDIKLVYGSGEPLVAKAYLGFRPIPNNPEHQVW